MSKELHLLNEDGTSAPLAGVVASQTTLFASKWSSLAQTVNVAGVTADRTTCHVIVTPAPGSHDAYSAAAVRCTAQGAGKLTFGVAEEAPEVDLVVNIMILK